VPRINKKAKPDHPTAGYVLLCMRACISAVDFLNMAKMKRKVLKVMATLILFGLVVNFVASRKAKHGLRVAIESPAVLDSDET